MKAKTKLLALAMSALTGVATFGLALHLTTQPAVAVDDTTTVTVPTATNLEDLVDDGSAIRWVYNTTSLNNLYTGTSTQEATIVNAGVQNPSGTLEYAIYNRASKETDTHTFTYMDYNGNNVNATDVNINANDYDGNYSFFATGSGSKTAVQDGGIVLTKLTNKDQIISFNMNYTDRRYDFFSRLVWTANANGSIPYYAVPSSTSAGSYYGIQFNTVDGAFIAYRNVVANKWNQTGLTNSSAKIVSKQEILENHYGEGTDASFDTLLKKNDVINVTYGTFDANNTTYTYFKLYNVTKGLLVFEETVDVGLDETEYGNYDTECMMKIQFQSRGDRDNSNYDRTPVTIGGVYEPLLAAKSFDTAIEAGKEDETVATIESLLPAGYVAKNLDQVLVGGENTVAATYTYKYYDTDNTAEGEEKTYEKDCVITVTAEAVNRTTLTLNDMNGNEIDTYLVKQNQDYTFEALDREKAFVAYKVGNNLYNVGDTVAVGTEGIEATLWEVDFKMNENVSVRLVDNDNGYGGLRYMAQMPASDWAVISESVTLKTMIVPTDEIVGDLNADEVGAQSKPATVADMTDGGVDYKIALFAITNIMHMNYDRKFTGAAYLEVTYANGETDYVMADTKSVSVYDLAVEAYAANAKEIAANGAPLYHDNDVAILEQYINGVVDISYVVDGDTLTIALAENGLDNLDRVYTLDSAKTSVTKNGEAYTVSVTLNVEGSVLETLLVDGESQAPVIVKNNNNQDEYTSVAVTREYDATAHTLKLTFDVNA